MDLELTIIELQNSKKCDECGLTCKIYDIYDNTGSYTYLCKSCSKERWGLTELEFKQIAINTITKSLILPYVFHSPKFETVYYYAKKIYSKFYSPYIVTEELIRQYYQNYLLEFNSLDGAISLKKLLETVSSITLLFKQLDNFQSSIKKYENLKNRDYYERVYDYSAGHNNYGTFDYEYMLTYEYLDIDPTRRNIFATGILNQDIKEVDAFRDNSLDIREEYLIKKGEDCLLLIDEYSKLVISFKASIMKRDTIDIDDNNAEPQTEKFDYGLETRVLRIYSNETFEEFTQKKLIQIKKINFEQAIEICSRNIICRDAAQEEYYISYNTLDDGYVSKYKIFDENGDLINYFGDSKVEDSEAF